jgi:hypothetical protein
MDLLFVSDYWWLDGRRIVARFRAGPRDFSFSKGPNRLWGSTIWNIVQLTDRKYWQLASCIAVCVCMRACCWRRFVNCCGHSCHQRPRLIVSLGHDHVEVIQLDVLASKSEINWRLSEGLTCDRQTDRPTALCSCPVRAFGWFLLHFIRNMGRCPVGERGNHRDVSKQSDVRTSFCHVTCFCQITNKLEFSQRISVKKKTQM